ncbi:response regulator [Paenibacillus doosanensis]|uniref:response regulator transcription factor n=1 Tax=Paenibacillus doosanensis TaxID=1229154 RepID=UPI00217F6778|nr:response regulator [Paenibacillus doosanensis]MCS7464134.1 response regulator [Paenibacillus doosanensis]
MKICVIDDEIAVRSGVIVKLNRLNKPIEVFDAGFGEAALENVRRIRPDIVITDIMMPGLTGLELLQQLKEELPAVRVFLLTGYSEFEYARRAIQLGAMGYLLKPANRKELLKLVSDAEREESGRLAADLRRYAAQLREREMHLEPAELLMPFSWYDETVPKRIRLAADPAGMALEAEREAVIFSFKYKLHVDGAVVRADWKEHGCFARGDEFIPAFIREAERWEAKQFFAPDGASRQRGGEARLKQSSAMRQSIVQAVKEMDVSELEQRVDAFLRHAEQLELKQLRKECAYLMAMLDEAMTAGHNITIVEEDKLDYWFSWVVRHPSWRELKRSVERFVVGGVKALAELDSNQQPTDLVDKAMQLVHRHKGADINLESVAAALSVHSVTLSRIFKQHTGENFVRYVVRHKMKQAERQLVESDKKVGEIAEEAGYADYRYFSQLFKQAYGLSPSEYRKRHIRPDR